MKTLRTLTLLVLFMAGFLIAQTDSTETIVPEQALDSLEVVESDEMVADSTETEFVTQDSTELEMLSMDSTMVDTTSLVESDSVEVVEPEMTWVPREPAPTVISGLINQGSIYYWSNDGLGNLDFTDMDYITIEDPSMIAEKANDCMDIVCHLLATDSSSIDYVIVTPEDSSSYQIFDTETKSVVIEANSDSLLLAFHVYLQDMAGMEYIAVVETDDAFIGPTLTEPEALISDRYDGRAKALKIKRRQFRSFDAVASNPANLARDFDAFVSLNLIPDVQVNIQNTLLTPGWYGEWLTVGGVWDEAMQEEYRATVQNKDLGLNISPRLNNFGFRIWRVNLDVDIQSYVKVILPGNLLALPMQDILFDEPVELGKIDIETIPVLSKSSLSYAHPLSTPFGDVKLGVSLNNYLGADYVRVTSDDFTLTMGQDSTVASATGEGWYTSAGIEGRLDSLLTDDMDAMETASDPGFGIDLGVIFDLEPLTNQELEVQVSLLNIGASYKISGLTHETWSITQTIPTPDLDALDTIEMYLEEFQDTETVTIGTDETLSIEIPSVLNVSAVYQPVSRIIIGAGIEKAFLEEDRFGYTSDLAINYQLNIYATQWLDLSYYKQTQFGNPVHTFGGGFHFGFLETGLSVSFFNGLNANIKGIGLGLRSSLHF